MSRFLTFLLVASFLLTGCVKQQYLERVTLFVACAFDEAPDKQIELTIAAPKYHADKPGFVSNMLYSELGHTSKHNVKLMDMHLNRPINSGKLSVILFGKELAAKGLANELDVALRDAQSSRKMFLAVVDGNAKEMLQANFSPNEEKGLYLTNLIDTNVRTGLVPRRNLHEFEYSYLGQGMDPFLPLLTLQKDHIVISGLALFKGDKYVLSLNEKQMGIVKLLLENTKYGVYEVNIGDQSYIAMENTGSNVHYRINNDKISPSISIDLMINGTILDARGVHLPKQEQQSIKKRFEDDIATMGTQLIKRFKKEGIDPLGLGDFVRSKTRNWNEEEWKKQYPTLNVNLSVKVNLMEMGIRK
jgi:spore germination protein